MKNRFTRSISMVLILVLALVVALAAFATSSESVKAQDEKIGVVVTIPPLAEFVEGVGGDKVEVTVMVPPGASPHTYEPTAGQMIKVSEAEMYAKVGSGVEFEITYMDAIIDQNPNIWVVDCSQGIELMGSDPHIWLSPLNAIIMVENIYAGLIEVDFDNAGYYVQNRDQYLQELQELDEYIRERLEGIKNRWFMAYHPAWGYFARDYDLEQIAIEREGKEPTAAEIAASVEKAREHNIKDIFVSPQFAAESAEVIASEIGGGVMFIDPLAEDYVVNMRMVAGQIAQAGAEGQAQNQWWLWIAIGIGGIVIGATAGIILATRTKKS